MRIEDYIARCQHNCQLLSDDEIMHCYNIAMLTSNSVIMNTLFFADCGDEISPQQKAFDSQILTQIIDKEIENRLDVFTAKWKKVVDDGVINSAKQQRLRKKLITNAHAWLKQGSTYITATKTSVNKTIRWSSSRHTEMRKKDVVDEICGIANNKDNKQLLIQHFSSGSVCKSGGLGGSGAFTVISVNCVTLLRTHNDNNIYRFLDDTKTISHRLEQFEFDDALDLILTAYDTELELAQGDSPKY